MKKFLSILLALCMVLSLSVTAFAATTEKESKAPQVDSIFEFTDNYTVKVLEKGDAKTPTMVCISATITDANVIKNMVGDGIVEIGEEGTYPNKVVIDQIIPEKDYLNSATQQSTSRGISISKYDYYDGRYFDEYDRYVVDGPSEFTQTYSRTSTASWNSSMSGSMNVGGTIYGIAEVKAAVSSSMGYTIGSSYTKSSSYKVNVPANKYWNIKIWTSYRVFSYTAKVGSTTLSTGKAWYPNGLVILHTEYNR